MHCSQAWRSLESIFLEARSTAYSSCSGFVVPCQNINRSRMPQWQGSKVQVEHLQFVSINESIIFYKKNWTVSTQIIWIQNSLRYHVRNFVILVRKTRFVVIYYARAASIRLLATCLRLRPVRVPATLSVAFSTSVLPALRMISTCVGWPW